MKLLIGIILTSTIYSQKFVSDIIVPDTYFRQTTIESSFNYFLRKNEIHFNKPVLLFDGKKKHNQQIHYAVLNIDIGKKNLQQCADAVMRLRAEYLYKTKQLSKIKFNFTSGHEYRYDSFLKGVYPKVSGNKVEFKNGSKKVNSYQNFRKYMDIIFTYAGTYSLKKESIKVKVDKIEVGDFFIQGGFTGHAMIVIDLAENSIGEKIMLLAQSYMPAQSIHIVKNLEDQKFDPWYKVNSGEKLMTPEWVFDWSDLYRFR
jgi:hypothetical protein